MAKRDEAGLTGLDRGLLVEGEVSLVLSGAFVFMRFIKVHFGATIRKAGEKLGLDEVSSMGFLASTLT